MSAWTEADIKSHYDRLKRPVELPAETQEKTVAKGRAPWKPAMNATERAYNQRLQQLVAVGEVLWFGFQVVTLLLGPDCRFTPDFLILYADGRLELHDTKGAKKIKIGKRAGLKTFHAEEDALVKARMTAAAFPIPMFFVWSSIDGGWAMKEFGL